VVGEIGASAAQVLLRWCLQRLVTPAPLGEPRSHPRQPRLVHLTADQMATLAALDDGLTNRMGPSHGAVMALRRMALAYGARGGVATATTCVS
jgi:diketogulonate reductase-like aldo/keto reductase